MGKRGARKKLTAFEILEGRPGKRPLMPPGIEALGEPFIAEHLKEDAPGCIEVIKSSMPQHVYSALDSFLLAAFGMAWAVHKRAALEISNPNFEYVLPTPNGALQQSPWLHILNRQALTLATLGDRLGLDPKSRAALHLPQARQQKSKFDGLLGIRPDSLLAKTNLNS
jgi:phage terminase small subunit